MLRNYLITTLRNFFRHKLYSFINIAGLSIGLACAILIALFVRDELSYDKWIPDSAHLYRLGVNIAIPGRELMKTAVSPFAMPIAMLDRIPEVKAATRLVQEPMTVTTGDHQFAETVEVVDPNFLQVIKLPLLEGDPKSALAQPESIVLSQSMARKYFGNSDPVGKIVSVIQIEKDKTGNGLLHSLTVTGVLRDLPHNTQLVADVLVPNTSQVDAMPRSVKDDWQSQTGWGYVVLEPNADLATVIEKIKPIMDQHVNTVGISPKPLGSEFEQPHLTQFWEDHLSTDNFIGGGPKPPGSWTIVRGLAAIAGLILLVACFNFVNLATARATLRAREVSLRKAVGATRQQLVTQFLGEAVVMAVLSLVVALALVEVLLPLYSQFLDRPLSFHYFQDWTLSLSIIATAIGAGLIGGLYPAFVLSHFRPAAVLKANASSQSGSGVARLTLVVLQFAVSIGLGIATLVVFQQINYLRRSDLGFNHDGVIVIYTGHVLTPSAQESFSQALTNNSAITATAQSNAAPFAPMLMSSAVAVPGSPQQFVFRRMDISPEFPSLYDMRLLAGRPLSRARGEDKLLLDVFSPGVFDPNQPKTPVPNEIHSILVNAAATRRFGWTAVEAVGKTITFNDMTVRIVGVLDDPKLDGVQTAVEPMIYGFHPEGASVFSVRVRAAGLANTLSHIDRTWHSFAPTSPIQRFFLSDSFAELFKGDERRGQMLGLFVGIAIFIACLGLFGLAAFTAQRRTKEIGVRKVFGARTVDVVRLLLWQISVPVLIANLIAWPIAYGYLRHWLEGYAYRISLNPIYFLAVGATALLIAWITIFAHALKVALANPIRALRYE